MPYTLAKGFAWVALALLLGFVIGWLLRSVLARRQLARARAHHGEDAELASLRARARELDEVVAERDRLHEEIDGLRDELAARDARPPPAEPVQPPEPPGPPPDPSRDVSADDSGLDLATGAAVLGRPIAVDDLQVVEGIGPNVEQLCNGIGIRTWFDLAATEVSLLRTMLTDAGHRFRSQDPSTWPEQAGLLARGRWEEFRSLADELQRERAND